MLKLMSQACGGSRAALPADARMKPTRRATTDTSSLVQAKLKPVMPVIHEDNLYVQVPWLHRPPCYGAGIARLVKCRGMFKFSAKPLELKRQTRLKPPQNVD